MGCDKCRLGVNYGTHNMLLGNWGYKGDPGKGDENRTEHIKFIDTGQTGQK